jgi:hypothetical protein
VPGVWAAGNASNPRAQVITAAGEGSAVAIAINTDLVKDHVDTAVEQTAAASGVISAVGGASPGRRSAPLSREAAAASVR